MTPETTNVVKGDMVAIDCLDFQNIFNKIFPQVFLGQVKLAWDGRGGLHVYSTDEKVRDIEKKEITFFFRGRRSNVVFL